VYSVHEYGGNPELGAKNEWTVLVNGTTLEFRDVAELMKLNEILWMNCNALWVLRAKVTSAAGRYLLEYGYRD